MVSVGCVTSNMISLYTDPWGSQRRLCGYCGTECEASKFDPFAAAKEEMKWFKEKISVIKSESIENNFS